MLPKNEQVLRLGSGRRGPHPAIGAEDGAYIFPNGVRDDGRVLRLVPEFLVAQLAKVGAVVQDLINQAFVDGLALHSAFYQWVLRLGEELRIRHGNCTFGKWLIQLARTDVLLLDDWGMAGIDAHTRADLLEIIDDRAANKATIITPQLPIEHWHAWGGGLAYLPPFDA